MFAVSVDLLKAKHDWRPGRAVAEARAELAERQRIAGEQQAEHDTAPELDALLDV